MEYRVLLFSYSQSEYTDAHQQAYFYVLKKLSWFFKSHCSLPHFTGKDTTYKKGSCPMFNYLNSDYARNKNAAGIVYHSIAEGCTWVVSLEDYLTENPDNTAEDFHRLKDLSDEIYLEQDRLNCKQMKNNISIHSLEYSIASYDLPLDEMYIKKQDIVNAAKVIGRLSRGDDGLTDIQRKRFILHVIKDMKVSDIAGLEGADNKRVLLSINSAKRKVTDLFVRVGGQNPHLRTYSENAFF